MKVLLLLAIFSLAPVTMYIMYTRTGGPESQKEMKVQKNLRYAFMGGIDAIDLAPLSDTTWEKVCAVTDNVSRAELTKIIGFDYEHFQELHWLHLKDHWTLLFIGAEREVNWGKTRPVMPVRIPRKELADLKLTVEGKGQCITRGGRAEITRRSVPVGESPVVLQLVDAAAD